MKHKKAIITFLTIAALSFVALAFSSCGSVLRPEGEYTITEAVPDGGKITVYVNGVQGETKARPGDGIRVTLGAEKGYFYKEESFTVNGAKSGFTFVMPSENVSLNAEFVKKVYSIEGYEDYLGQVIPSVSSASYGDEFTITVKPKNKYCLLNGRSLTMNGAILERSDRMGERTYKLVMPDTDVTFDAFFTEVITFQGEGTKENPWLIEYDYHIDEINAAVEYGLITSDSYFKLVNDVSIETCIGSYENPFVGNFDGNGHTIEISVAGARNLGVFSANAGTVKNLTVKGNVTASGGTDTVKAGGVAGYNSGVVENCVNYAIVYATEYKNPHHFGGVVGYNTGSVISCANYGNVGNKNEKGAHTLGGVIGFDKNEKAAREIRNCKNYGEVFGDYEVGGIIGRVENNSPVTVKDCVNEGKIIAEYRVGGISGFIPSGATIDNCVNGDASDKNKGEIFAESENERTNDCVGGIVGNIYSSTVKNCVNYGKVTSTFNRVGGIAGHADGVDFQIENCKNYGDVTGKAFVGGIIGRGIGKTFNGSKLSECKAYINDSVNFGNVSGTQKTADEKYYVGGIGGSVEKIVFSNVLVAETVTVSYFENQTEVKKAITELPKRYASKLPYVNVLFGYGNGTYVKELSGKSGICNANGEYLRNVGAA